MVMCLFGSEWMYRRMGIGLKRMDEKQEIKMGVATDGLLRVTHKEMPPECRE